MRGQSASPGRLPGDRPRVGLVLGGGGALGLAHIGVLVWLQENHIPVDAITGNSMGAFVGGLYAAGVPVEDIDRLATMPGSLDAALSSQTDYRTLNARRREDRQEMPASLTVGLHPILPGGLVLEQGIYQILDQYLLYVPANQDFAQLPIPFRTISTDVSSTATISSVDQTTTGSKREASSNRYVWCGGDLRTAIRSSISVPGLLSPVVIQEQPDPAQPQEDAERAGCSQRAVAVLPTLRRGEMYLQHQLVDGELVDNFPVDLMVSSTDGKTPAAGPKSRFGGIDPVRDVIIGVSFPGTNMDQTSLGLETMLPAGTSIADTQSELRMRALLREQPHHLLIVPQTQSFSAADYAADKVVTIIAEGYAAAARTFAEHPEILALIHRDKDFDTEYSQYLQDLLKRVHALRAKMPKQTDVTVNVVDGHASPTDKKRRKAIPMIPPDDRFKLSPHQVTTDQNDEKTAKRIATSDRLNDLPLKVTPPRDEIPKNCLRNSHRTYPAPFLQVIKAAADKDRSMAEGDGQSSDDTVAKCSADERIERTLRKLDGSGTYEADYTPAIDGNLQVHMRSFSNGPNFTSVGLESSAETGGVARATAEAGYVQPYGRGDELRVSVKAGFLTQVKADTDVPLGLSGFHFVPEFTVLRQPVYFYVGQARMGEAFEQRVGGGTEITYQPGGKSVDLRLAWRMGQEYWYQRYGSGAGPYTFTKPLLDDPLTVRLSLTRDTQSGSLLPVSGGVLKLTGGYRFHTGSKSNVPFVTSELSRSITLSAKLGKTCLVDPKCAEACAKDPGCTKPRPLLGFLGTGWVLHGRVLTATDFHRTEAEPYKYAVGGPFELSAYQIGEFRTTDYALGKAYLFKQVIKLPPPLGEGIYLFAGADGGGVFNVQSLALKPLSVNAGFALVTPLGAISLGGAVGAEGHRKVYFAFGKMF